MKASPHTFTVVVMTAPSGQIAAVYSHQLADLKNALQCMSSSDIYCVADPKGERVGSGGGTLNALHHVANKLGRDLAGERILMIHSGGDARRVPTCSVIGKAWSSLNSLICDDVVASPMALLISELSLFFENLPLGSLVVASSDVMLDICCIGTKIQFKDNAVTLVTVPESPGVAKNHGVVVVADSVRESEEIQMTHAVEYLQKPSVVEMKSRAAIRSDAQVNLDSYVWIDTGVVAFCGTALAALLRLVDAPEFESVLGLKQENSSRSAPTTTRLRIELYSEILLACSVNSTRRELSAYWRALKIASDSSDGDSSLYGRALRMILEFFGEIPLTVSNVISGIFSHLGTTEELKNLLLSSSLRGVNFKDSTVAKEPRKLAQLAKKYSLESSVLSQGASRADIVTVVSYLGPRGSVGTSTMVEYSLLTGNYSIGENSVVSYVRNNLGDGLVLNKNLILQQVPLRLHETTTHQFPSCYIRFALLLLSVTDDVKAQFRRPDATVCGNPWSNFFSAGCLKEGDIWLEQCNAADRSLWTAKIFPVILVSGSRPHRSRYASIGSRTGCLRFHSLSAIRNMSMWFQDSLSRSSEGAFEIGLWKESVRCSLADLLGEGNAFEMRNWRNSLCTVFRSTCDDRGATADTRPDVKGDKLMYCLQRTLLCLSVTVAEITRRLPVPECVLCSRGQKTEIESGLLSHSVILMLWCWRLAFPPSDAHSFDVSRFLRVAVKQISTYFISEIDAHDNPDTLRNMCYLIVYSFLDMWDKVESCLPYFTICIVAKNIGKISKPMVRCVIKGFSMFACTVLETCQPRLLLILSWVLQNSSITELCLSRSEMFAVMSSVQKTSEQCDTNLIETKDAGIGALCSILDHIKLALEERRVLSSGAKMLDINEIVQTLDDLSQALISAQVNWSLNLHRKNMKFGRTASVLAPSDTIVASAPARIDLMGGWSDTPPICYQAGGAVLNVSICVDHVRPLVCAVRFIPEKFILLRSARRVGVESAVEILEEVKIGYDENFEELLKDGPRGNCALLIACIAVLNLVTRVQETLDGLVSPYNGIEIVSCSVLPTGSGMGGSSVLAAVVVHAINTRLGDSTSREMLMHTVSQIEQILTTGGGWQDQAGAIYGGLKLAYCSPGLPMEVFLKTLVGNDPTNPSGRLILSDFFEKRVMLLYTGQQRLAKDTLVRALKYCAMSPLRQRDVVGDVVRELVNRADSKRSGTISNLIDGAITSSHAIEQQYRELCDACEGDSLNPTAAMLAHALIDNLGRTITTYWALKREMAQGSEPLYLQKLRNDLSPYCLGWSLCGAGGGGFAVAVLKREVTASQFLEAIENVNAQWRDTGLEPRSCSAHTASLDFDGVSARVITNQDSDESAVEKKMLHEMLR